MNWFRRKDKKIKEKEKKVFLTDYGINVSLAMKLFTFQN